MKKFLSLVLALAMTMSLVTISAGAKDFTDADKVTYTEAVDVMTAIGVIDGDAAGNVNPTAGLTRGAAAKIICNMILGPTTASALNADAAPYKDVPVNSTFAGYIAYCQQQGIISGYADGTFKPAAPLTGYAFMKMLLGALGYDVDVEGYTGANWSIAVAKRALNIGLDDGLTGEFNGSAYITREEAMLYAFNTLQATMVEYDSKTNISIGGAEVVIAGSSAKEVAEGNYDNNMKKDNLQFAEKYFKDLKKVTGDSDAFERPSTTWKLKKVEIGTYTDTPDLTYTTSVELGDIYADLSLSDEMTFATSFVNSGKAVDDVFLYYIDGQLVRSSVGNISKGNDDNEIGGNGALTEVYYDSDDNTAVIVTVNTYVGEIVAVEEATAKEDAYVVVDELTSGSAYVTMADNEFETESFEEDDVVLFTYSYKSDEDCIQSVALAEKASGEVTKYTGTKSLVLDGTKYEYAAKTGAYASTVDVDKTVYLDEYGYVIYVDETETAVVDFAYVLDAGVDTLRGGTDKWAKLLYTDGTVETVTAKEDYSSLKGSFVSYKTNSSNKVVLTKASSTTYTVNCTKNDVASGTQIAENGKVTVTFATGTNYPVNNNTLFLLYSKDDGNADVYTGIKNVPDVKATAQTTAAVLSKSTAKAAAIVVVYVDEASVTDENTDVLFLRGDSNVTYTEDSDGKYYVFDAILNGEITEVALDYHDAQVSTLLSGKNVVATKYTVDDGVYTISEVNTTIGTKTAVVSSATSISKISGGVISVNGTAYAVADDVAIYRVSTAGKISVVSASALRDDSAIGNSTGYFQQVSVAFNSDKEVTAIFLELM